MLFVRYVSESANQKPQSVYTRLPRHVALGEVTRGARLRDFVTETTASHSTISLPKCTGFTSEQRKVRFTPFWSVMIAGG
ncbi:hypothetical protein ANANG_G00205840 [Anguilla anguilla]|uniref:Uncharacterized protein n=1 Tax=Anguilla anguilla TaxID=7936 RepID=A0A9D3RQX7_ANGAN|nr:hypothetical protein ANANG_G00205840 [Anguilla anguilla]